MTSAALVFMTIFWSLVISMLILCYAKMLRSERRFGAAGPRPAPARQEDRT